MLPKRSAKAAEAENKRPPIHKLNRFYNKRGFLFLERKPRLFVLFA